MNDLQALALGFLQGRLSLLPCDEKTKRPRNDLLPVDENGKPTWKPYQEKPPTVETVKGWFARGCKAVGVVCGQASGGLCVLDFDEPSYYPAWQEAVGDLADGLPVQRTGREGGGYQVAFRCPDPGKNDKLAWHPDEDEETGRTIAIETRGNGGFVISPGSLHPSGRRYEAIAGDWSNIPTVSQARAEALLAAARKLDCCPLTRQQRDAAEQRAKLEAETKAERNGEGSVIDLFNERNPIRATLERHGYKRAGARYHRPGAPAGLPASVVVFDGGRSFHHDSDDPLSDGHAHRPFDVFAHYEHGGDLTKAVKAAAEALGVAYKRNGEKASGACDKTPGKPGKGRVLSQSWQEFPVNSLPEPVAGFVRAGSKAIGCDPSYIGVPLLAALASAIGATTRIELKPGWSEPAVVWAGIVGDSGSLKSPAHDLAVGPLKRLQAWAMTEYPELCQQYARDLALYEADLGAWKRKGRDKNEPPPERPTEPQPKRYLVDDTTIEALCDRLAHNPRGLLCAADELAGWLQSFGQYKSGGKSGDVARWLSIHRADSLLVDRKTGAIKTVFVPRAAVSVCGSIQPEVLRRCISPEYFSNGLAARLLLAWPPRQAKTWTEAIVDPSLQRQIDRIFARLLAFGFHENDDGQQVPVTLPLSASGKRAWVAFYNEHAREQAALSGPEAACAAKLEGYAARLALIVHLVRVCADDSTVDTEEVDADSIASGVALVEWFGNEARRVYSVFDESDEDADLRQLVEMIQRQGGQITSRELQRARHLDTAEEADAILSGLVKAGYCERVSLPPTPQGGRPSDCFRLLQGCDKTPSNPEENGGYVTKPGQSIDEINRRFAEL